MDDHKGKRSPLSEIKRDLPFAVPEGYFDQFQTRLEVAIHARKNRDQFKLHVLRPYMAAAVMLIIALLAGTWIFRINHDSRDERSLAAELSRVIEQELYSIPEETILEIMASDQADEPVTNSASSDDLIEYLLDENLNEEELLNNL